MSIGNSTNRVTDLQRVSAANTTSSTLAANDVHSFTDVYEQAQIHDLVTRLNDRAAHDPQGFRDSLELALGSRADRQSIDDLIDAAVSGNLPLPNVRFVEPGALGAGAMGAYDASNGGTILLDRSLLSDPGALERVFTEEVGHHFDALMGAGDAAGDEGAIFAQSLSGRTLSPAELSSLRSENDHGSVVLDGRKIGVEFHLGSDTPGGSVEGIGGNDSNVGGGAPSHTNGNSETDRNPPPKPKPKPPPAPVIPEPPAPIVQPSELLGPVSLPPAPVDDPITELNTFLQGTPPENLLGPVGGGAPTEENPPRTEDTNKPAPLAGSSTVPIAPPNPISSPGWFTRGIGLVGGFLRSALAGGGAVVGATVSAPFLAGFSRPAGDVYDVDWTGTGTTVHVDGPAGRATVFADGVDTGIQVTFEETADGQIRNIQPVTAADAAQLTQLTGMSWQPAQPGNTPAPIDAPLEPEPIDNTAMLFDPLIPTGPEALPIPEPEITVASAPTLPQPVSAPLAPVPPDVQAPVATVAAPNVPDVPPLTPPVIDNGPMVNPQSTTGADFTSMPGGSNDAISSGTPGFEETQNTGSSITTPADEPPPSDNVLLKKASETLGGNLIDAGLRPPMDANNNRVPGWQAHHIIPFGDKRASELRDKLENEWGIDINAAANGVWLPQNDTISNPDGVTPHNQTFRDTYFDFLTREFQKISTREGALDILESIREGLESGELQFELAKK